ncbi:hypothetical protein [Nitrososphaera sp. AFS]|jgi:hypothetical protein|uniref:hypothetical protein n=1 Tax=Nitrososphaera sp. AFS TaxID=2301191 RepID=UPI0013922C2F|nr:hypothetical protein [Nitrososphaera sp. AFS]NAL78087.1 hypothetical protein [Nitrososphaera sp. AFS]
MSEPQRRPDYPGRDASIIANNIFKQLCDLPEGWHDIRPLAMNIGVFANSEDVTYVGGCSGTEWVYRMLSRET